MYTKAWGTINILYVRPIARMGTPFNLSFHMKDFLIHFSIISLLILGGIFFSARAYVRTRQKWLAFFSGFLSLSLVLQWTGFLYSHYTKKSNHFIFNINLFIELCFFSWLFFVNLREPVYRRLAAWIGSVSIGVAVVNLGVGQGFFLYNSYTFYTEALAVIILCLVYFFSILRHDAVIIPFREPMFWICTGLFFFYSGDVVYFLLLDYILSQSVDSSATIFRYLSLVLDIIQYGFFIIGFVKGLSWTTHK